MSQDAAPGFKRMSSNGFRTRRKVERDLDHGWPTRAGSLSVEIFAERPASGRFTRSDYAPKKNCPTRQISWFPKILLGRVLIKREMSAFGAKRSLRCEC